VKGSVKVVGTDLTEECVRGSGAIPPASAATAGRGGGVQAKLQSRWFSALLGTKRPYLLA
jgi:hypothetical protein